MCWISSVRCTPLNIKLTNDSNVRRKNFLINISSDVGARVCFVYCERESKSCFVDYAGTLGRWEIEKKERVENVM